MTVFEVIQLARKHASNGEALQSSAQLCLEDAEALYDRGQSTVAYHRAVKSLRYSVGIFHPDYRASTTIDPTSN